jgi:hypothetical protein
MTKFKWTVEFEVDAVWVEDGFNLDGARAQNMIENALPWAHDNEIKAHVIKAPSVARIRRTQGYPVK